MLLCRARVHFTLVVSKQFNHFYYLAHDVTQPSSCGIECYPYICMEFIGSTKYRMLGLEIVTKPCISISTISRDCLIEI